MFNGRRQPSRGGTSRMTRECQVRFCEGLGVKFPGPTRQQQRIGPLVTVPLFPPRADIGADIVEPPLRANRRHCHFCNLRKGASLPVPVPVDDTPRRDWMKLPRRRFLHLAACAAVLPSASRERKPIQRGRCASFPALPPGAVRTSLRGSLGNGCQNGSASHSSVDDHEIGAFAQRAGFEVEQAGVAQNEGRH
jgi:hypothetical protein